MLYDEEHLKRTLNIKSISKFTYNNNKYSAFLARDGSQWLINCFGISKTIPYEAWLKTHFRGYYLEDLEENKPNFEIVEPTSSNIDSLSYLSHLKAPLIDDEFITSMGIEIFAPDYKKHPNIKRFDYTAWSKEEEIYSTVQGEHDVLFSSYDENINIRYKKGRWQNIKGGKNTGAFIQGTKKNSILLLCEGLKDGINASIGFTNVDILITDGKNQAYDFEKYSVNLTAYKNIIYANDRDVTNEETLKLFSLLESEHYDKVKMIDWSLFELDLKDISNILKEFYSTGAKSAMKRKALPLLKKKLLPTAFSLIHKEALNQSLTNKSLGAINRNTSLDYIIKQKDYHGFNLDVEAKHIIALPLHSKKEVELPLNKYLKEVSPTIVNIIKNNHITLLNSPTNTGKSTIVKDELTDVFENIIYIAPLRAVVDEFSFDGRFTNVSQKGQKIEATLADMNASFIAVTTDVFFNLLSKFESEMKQRLSDAVLIVFDEQHLISESENFREKVTEVNKYLLKSHSGKVLFMSGTPHIESDKVTVIKATVAKNRKDDIYYHNNAFADEEVFIMNVLKEVEKHSVMIYCSSTQKVEEVSNLLRGRTNCFSITSRYVLWNGSQLNGDSLDPKDYQVDTCVYVCTTRATTGLNLPNLKGIYQYGTAYNANTFIQLMARLRSGGFYHYITPFMERNTLENAEQRAIGLCKKFQSMDIVKLSNSWGNDSLQRYLVDNLSIERDKRTLEGFLSTYNIELKIVEAYGLGNLTLERDDYIFNLQGKEVDKILKGLDETIERKFIDRILIDYLNKNNISLLNEIYNLSFVIHDGTLTRSDKELRLITDEDKAVKKAKREETTARNKIQKEKILAKIGHHFSYASIKKEFGIGEIDRLIESNCIDEERIAKARIPRDKLVILREALISTKEIVTLAVDALVDNEEVFTVKHLDMLLQQEYPTKKRHKYPYSTFLKALLSSVYEGDELRIDNRLLVKTKEQRENKSYYDVIRFKEAFDPTQTKEFIEKESKRIDNEYRERLSAKATAQYGFEVIYEEPKSAKQ